MMYEGLVDVLVLQELVKRAKTKYTCMRGPRPSGALLQVKATRIWGDVTSINGTETCQQAGCMMEDGHCVRNIHAEVAALLVAARMGIATEGGTMYSINKPCFNCTKACAKAGISKIVYAYAVYDEPRTTAVIEAAGIECIHVNIE